MGAYLSLYYPALGIPPAALGVLFFLLGVYRLRALSKLDECEYDGTQPDAGTKTPDDSPV